MQPLSEKYRPKNFEDIKGQDQALEKIKAFIASFTQSGGRGGTYPKKRAILLHGPPGTGKTTIAHVLANETNSEIFELNASDLRNRGKLREILRPATEQQSLIKKNKIILVDEVDGISRADWGGITELVSIISTTPFPIVITANDAWNKSLAPLRKKTELIQIKEINYTIIKNVLIDILRKENKFIDSEILTNLSVKANGDLRAAINDLQTIADLEDPSSAVFDERNKETDIFNSLKQIFKAKPTNETLKIFDSVNMSIDEIMLWVEENIPAEYQGEELAKAIDMLSKVDLFKGRIYKKQYWRFLVYENIFLSYGISAAKNSNKPQENSFTPYKRPTRILKIWLNNQRTAKKKSITEKYAALVHVGKKRALNEFPIIKYIINSNPEIQKELKLNEEEIEYLRN